MLSYILYFSIGATMLLALICLSAILLIVLFDLKDIVDDRIQQGKDRKYERKHNRSDR